MPYPSVQIELLPLDPKLAPDCRKKTVLYKTNPFSGNPMAGKGMIEIF
jgi:hypothetical protein